MSSGEKPITELLSKIKSGEREALNDLLPLVYRELRNLANARLKNERSDHTLQPTALVHEAYLRLAGCSEVKWENRAHFFGIAARLMREILVDYARARNSQKRGGKLKTQIALDSAADFNNRKLIDVYAVSEALERLETMDERQARIVEMKFLCGLKIEEIAEVLDVSPATVKREWSSARLFLYKILDTE